MGKRKVRGAEGKINTATLTRHLFGSILSLSMQQKIDMAENLKYLLTPVPLWLCHVDGSVNLNPKSNLLNHFDLQFVTFLP